MDISVYVLCCVTELKLHDCIFMLLANKLKNSKGITVTLKDVSSKPNYAEQV